VNQQHKYLHPAFRFFFFFLSPCGPASSSCTPAISFSTASTSFLFLSLSFVLSVTTSSTNTVPPGSRPGTASAAVVWKVAAAGVVVVPSRRALTFAAHSATGVIDVRIWSSTAGAGAGADMEGGESAGVLSPDCAWGLGWQCGDAQGLREGRCVRPGAIGKRREMTSVTHFWTRSSLFGVFVDANGYGDGSAGAEGASSTGVASCAILAFALAAAFSRLRASFCARFRSFSSTSSPSTSTPSTVAFPSTIHHHTPPRPHKLTRDDRVPPPSSASPRAPYSASTLHRPGHHYCRRYQESSFCVADMCARRPPPNTPKPAPEPAVDPDFSRYCSPTRESSTRVLF
jgi:hypothetical protein